MAALGAVAVAVVVQARRAPPKNLLMIVVDTQRVDKIGAYNPGMASSPNLDALASESLFFERAWAQGAYTIASYMAYMSSTHTRTHGIDGDLGPGGICGWDDLKMLPEVLGEAGFRTRAYVANTNLHPKKGFPRGFETWNDLVVEEELGDSPLPRRKYAASDHKVVKRGLDAMAGWSDDQREFLYLHLMAPHLPLHPTRDARKALDLPLKGPMAKPIALPEVRKLRRKHGPKDEVRMRQGYEASVWDGDSAVQQILAGLEATGHADDTMVVMLSDHGEEIWEHGDYGHQDGVWEQLVHVPLMMRVPGVAPRRIGRPVMLIDVLPTVLDFLGVEATHEGWQGRHLLDEGERLVVTERFDERAATFDGRFKAVWRNEGEGKWRFFDVGEDPTEQQVLRPGSPEAQALKEAALAWQARTPDTDRSDNNVPEGICGIIDGAEAEEHRKMLEDLGYVEPDEG